MPKGDGAAARKARADALRRARDERNAEIERGAQQESPAKHVPADEGNDETPDTENADDDAPNFVDLIDRQMRRLKDEPEK